MTTKVIQYQHYIKMTDANASRENILNSLKDSKMQSIMSNFLISPK